MRRDFQPEEKNMKTPSTALARNMWIGTMAGTSTIASLLLACATPFPSLAALAATHVSRRDGLILMFVAWFAAQAVTLITHRMGSMAWPFPPPTAAGASLLSADPAARSIPSPCPAPRLGPRHAPPPLGSTSGKQAGQ